MQLKTLNSPISILVNTMMTTNSPHGDGDNAHDDDDDGDNAHDDDDNCPHGDGANADADDEPPQTNLPPIIADSRDPGGEVRLKV